MVARTRRFSDLTFRQPCWQADSERSLLVLLVAYQQRFTGARRHRIPCVAMARGPVGTIGAWPTSPGTPGTPTGSPGRRARTSSSTPTTRSTGIPWGPEALARARDARPADLPLGRLRRVPLVSRHGARVVRGRGDGRGAERGLRRDQGGPRGAPRSRSALHGRGPGDDGQRRLADERVPDPRRPPVLRRHLFPGHAAPRAPLVPPGARGRARRVDDAARRARGVRVAGWSRRSWRRRRSAPMARRPQRRRFPGPRSSMARRPGSSARSIASTAAGAGRRSSRSR